jgi:Txe/YoeB family toxin of Txe-Axe toxin-antitoxin module
MVVAHLQITTWAGISIGAIHWYCSIIVEENDKDVERTELKRPITAKEAATMNKEEQERGLLFSHNKAGDLTEGFMTEAEAIKAGIDYFTSKYKGVLYDSGYASCSAWKKVILCQPKFSELVNKMNALADKFQALNGYECAKKDEKLVEKIDNRWYKLSRKLEELCKSHV